MNISQQEKLLKQMAHLCNVHRGELNSAYIDYEIVTLYHPRYEQEYQQVLPLLVLDFAL